MKDEVTHRMFKVMTKHTEQVQFASQFKEQKDRDFHPNFWNLVGNVDELIQDPNKPRMNGRKTRAKPMVNFFGQPGIQTKKLGIYLKTVAENMIMGNQDGWTFADTTI